MKIFKYGLMAVLAAAAGQAAAFELPAMDAAAVKTVHGVPAVRTAVSRGQSYGEEVVAGRVWLPFRQEAPGWWTAAESDPFVHERIWVNVRKSGFMDDFEVDYTAGFGREMGTIRYFSSRFELSAAGTQVTADSRLDDYRIAGQVRLDNGRSVRISLDMEKEFNNESYVIRSTGLLLNVNKFGITGEVTNTIGYPKKVLAVLAAMAMAMFQSPDNGF